MLKNFNNNEGCLKGVKAINAFKALKDAAKVVKAKATLKNEGRLSVIFDYYRIQLAFQPLDV